MENPNFVSLLQFGVEKSPVFRGTSFVWVHPKNITQYPLPISLFSSKSVSYVSLLVNCGPKITLRHCLTDYSQNNLYIDWSFVERLLQLQLQLFGQTFPFVYVFSVGLVSLSMQLPFFDFLGKWMVVLLMCRSFSKVVSVPFSMCPDCRSVDWSIKMERKHV